MSNEDLTPIERLKMENSALRHQLTQQALQQIIAERVALIREIEGNHPGYKWDERTGLTQDDPPESVTRQ